jgi:hypothetical protein
MSALNSSTFTDGFIPRVLANPARDETPSRRNLTGTKQSYRQWNCCKRRHSTPLPSTTAPSRPQTSLATNFSKTGLGIIVAIVYGRSPPSFDEFLSTCRFWASDPRRNDRIPLYFHLGDRLMNDLEETNLD